MSLTSTSKKEPEGVILPRSSYPFFHINRFANHPMMVMKNLFNIIIQTLKYQTIMFVSSSNELQQFTTKLINERFAPGVFKTLVQEDQKQLRYVKIEMQEKMPKELQSKKYATLPSFKEGQKIQAFPRMFDDKNKKNYEYIDDNFKNIKKVAETFNEFPPIEKNQASIHGEILDKVIDLASEKQGEEQFQKKQESTPGEKPIPKEQQKQKASQKPSRQSRPLKQSKRQSQKTSKQKLLSEPIEVIEKQQSFARNASPNKAVEPSRVNPFISNTMNFMDPNANSKTLQSKYPHMNFNQNSRNIAAIAHSSKFNAFSNSVAFPTTVMPGTVLAPKETSFSKQAKLDVNDVMRYTLGVKKQSQGTARIQNPFHRPPKKKMNE